ncbi:MAG: NAD-dependent epimerase/dehydratase family protein [Nocardioidaceae bacterium]
MRLLVLGGSGFVGRAVVEEALVRGDSVTVLNRGTQVLPDVRSLVGDRRAPEGLAALRTEEWDAVVDTWSAEPCVVRDAARTLSDRAGHYTYISSRSVYRDDYTGRLDEDAPLVGGASPDAEHTNYAVDKLGGELAARQFAGPVLLARAGLVLGPYEDVGRLPWWLTRLAAGGPTLAPGPRDLPLQYIDARDLARFVLDAATTATGGVFNLVSPSGHTTMGELLDTATRVTGGNAELHWLDPEPILAAGIEPWNDLPVWLPPGPDHAFLHQGDVSKALAAGLTVRPVTETVEDTWAWLSTLDAPLPTRTDRPRVGLDPDIEARLLQSHVSRPSERDI